MTVAIEFKLYKSIVGGMVATGKATGEVGSAADGRLIWFGCQGESWEDLEPLLKETAETARALTNLNRRYQPIVVKAAEWPDEQVFRLPGGTNTDNFLEGLAHLNFRREPIQEEKSVRTVNFSNNAYVVFGMKGDSRWKPELSTDLIEFVEESFPRGFLRGADAYTTPTHEIIAGLCHVTFNTATT